MENYSVNYFNGQVFKTVQIVAEYAFDAKVTAERQAEKNGEEFYFAEAWQNDEYPW